MRSIPFVFPCCAGLAFIACVGSSDTSLPPSTKPGTDRAGCFSLSAPAGLVYRFALDSSLGYGPEEEDRLRAIRTLTRMHPGDSVFSVTDSGRLVRSARGQSDTLDWFHTGEVRWAPLHFRTMKELADSIMHGSIPLALNGCLPDSIYSDKAADGSMYRRIETTPHRDYLYVYFEFWYPGGNPNKFRYEFTPNAGLVWAEFYRQEPSAKVWRFILERLPD